VNNFLILLILIYILLLFLAFIVVQMYHMINNKINMLFKYSKSLNESVEALNDLNFIKHSNDLEKVREILKKYEK